MSVTYDTGLPRKVRFDWISEAWRLFSAQAVVWIVSALIMGLIVGGVSNILSRILMPSIGYSGFGSGGFSNPFQILLGMYSHVGFWINWIVTQAITAYLLCGLFRMANNQVRGLPISIGDLFGGAPILVPMLIYHIVSSVVSGIAYGLCFFPGLFVSALIWPGYALIADGADPGSAYTRGSEPMKKDLLMGAVFALVFLLIMIVSAVPCGLGLLVTLPMGILISSLMYRDMVGGLTAPAMSAAGAAPAAPGVWPPAPAASAPPPPVSDSLPVEPPAAEPPAADPPETPESGATP